VDVFMDLDTSRRIHQWLGERIQELTELSNEKMADK